ncbi:STAS domain-containing protein [Streptomyces sp. SAS_270]|uniref:STAS domain-containing protein n=1 Tax=Streptomyces sp. SAS_270 TaxID=3412748 RepID=UPI00403D47FB
MPDSPLTRKPREHRGLLGADNRLLHPFRRRERGAGTGREQVVVRLSGEITAQNAGRIGKSVQGVLGSRPGVLEVDLGRVSYFSSDGGAVFFMALRAARAQGTQVIATHVGPRARATLQQLGLGRVLDIYDGDGPGGS